MNHTAETIAANAIARSISHTEIVTLDDEGDLRTALLALCEDNVEANGVAEFWGTADDGKEWRVHVRLAGEPALVAKRNAYGWHVADDGSAIWWPGEEAEAEIDAADDPAAKAVEICSTSPMRGEWHS